MIKKIELENFKSYFGKKVIGPLHKNFTAVVGPNGSGKSNCIESLLFVFGKRAGQMRLKKLKELIHKSAQHGDCEKATVRVFFTDIWDVESDPDLYTEIEGTQFTVSRTIDNKDTSKYYKDDRLLEFKEICKLLQSKGIDLEHNRFLILQGEVEQISLMKPKAQNENETGLLEYLEEIIGSSVHIEQIKALSQQIDVENEKRIEQTNRVKASQSELNILDQDQQIALNFILQERRFWKFQNFKYYIEIQDQVGQFNSLTETFTQQKEILKHQKNQKRQILEGNELLVKDITELNELNEKAKEKLQSLIKEFNVLEKNDALVNNSIKQKATDVAKQEKKIKDLEQEKIQVIERNHQINNELPELENKSKLIQQKKSSIQKKYDIEDARVYDITQQLRQQQEKIDQSLKKKQTQLKTIKMQIEGKRSEISQFQSKKEKIDDEKDQIQEQLRIFNNKLEYAKKLKLDNEERYQSLQQQFGGNDAKQNQIQNQLQTLDRERQELEAKLNMMIGQNQKAVSGNNIINGLKEAQKQGILSGFYGRLGDLGTIDNKFDKAISTACGNLDSMVVETATSAEKCIEFLRKEKLGRANFICLERINEAYGKIMSNQFQCPNNSASRLFDLIQPNDEKFRIAFYFAIRDTLVCETLENATAINRFQDQQKRNRFRIVTLDGDLIESSGQISGGGRPKEGAMSSKRVVEYTDKEINEQKQKVEFKRQEKDKLLQQFRQFEQSLGDSQRNIREAKRAFDISLLDVNEFENQIKNLNKSLNENHIQQQKLEQEKRKTENFQNEISQIQDEHDKLAPQVEELQQNLQNLQEQILEAGGEGYKSLKDQLEKVTKELSEIERTIAKNKTTLSTADKTIKKLDEEINAVRQDVVKLQKDKESLLEDLKKNEIQAEELFKQQSETEINAKKCQDELEIRKNDFVEMKKKLQEINEEEKKIKEKLEETMQQRDVIKIKLDKIRQNIKANRDKYKNSEEEYFNDDQVPGQDQQPIQIDLDAEQIQSQQNAVLGNSDQSQMQKRQSIANSQIDVENSQRVQLDPADLRQGLEFFVQKRKISHTFQDNEIKILAKNKKEIEEEIMNLKQQLDEANPNVQIIAQYKQKKRDHDLKVQDLRILEQSLSVNKQQYDTLKLNRHKQFREGFDLIAKHLKQIYRLITNGGDADLETLDALDPFSEGVLFQVRPKNKTWKHMSKLSGGEKTLSSLSLIFALHIFKPSPLYCMDEIDAALDYKNVAIVGKYIREGVCKQGQKDDQHVAISGQARASQFIIISLRNNMFELADKMVGIYKTSDVTQTITINPKEMLLKIKETMQEMQNQKHLEGDKENRKLNNDDDDMHE